jgi:hypothetical protein
MKHVGKMKNNSARVVIAYRTLPGDPLSALVVGTQGLGDSYHDTLMTIVESESAQQANELADVLAVRRFPDGSNVLGYLHNNGHLIKVKTNLVNVTPDSQTIISLNELNDIIATQKGVPLEDLAVGDGSQKNKKLVEKKNPVAQEYVDPGKTDSDNSDFSLSPAELRSRADSLFKQAQVLRKQADELDPPKKKTKVEKVVVE